KDKRIYLGTLNRKPRSGTDELTLDAMRLAALRLSQTALEAGGLEHVKLSAAKQLHSSGEGSFGDLLDSYCDHLEQAGKVSARPVRRMLDAHVKAHHPALLRRPASKVRPEDIQL
ncbi:integrase, partial [Pseudomonas aeruginosa]